MNKLLLQLVLAVAPLPALASVSSFAELSNLQYSFRDLNVNDGITSSLIFGDGSGLRGGVPVSHALALAPGQGAHQFGTSAFAPVTATAAAAGTQAHSSVSGNGSLGSLRLASTGSGDGQYLARAGAPAPFRLDFDGFIPHAGTPFTLSAHTEVTFTALSVIGGTGGYAFATLYTEGNKAEFGGGVFDTFSNTLSVSFANPTSQSATGWFYAQVEAGATSLPPVPEPSTYALMSLGLLVLGIGRIKKRVPQSAR